MSNHSINQLSFEDALNELTNIAQRLERGQVPLAESVALYEKGVQLQQHCADILRKAQLRVDKLVVSVDKDMPAQTVSFDDSAH